MVDDTTKPPSLLTASFVNVVIAQTTFSYAISTFMLLPKYLATSLQASASEIGLTSALPGVAAVLLTPFVGGWLDRVGRKPLVSLGALLCAIYAAAWTAVDHVGIAVYALQLLSGAAFVLTFNATSTLATEAAPPARVGQAIGLFGAANISMNAIAPVVAEPLAARFGWPAAFALAAAAALLSLVLAQRIEAAPRGTRSPAGTSYAAFARTDVVDTLRVGRVIGLHIAAMVACGAAYGATLTFYQPFVLAQGAEHVSALFVGFTAATVGTRLLLGSVADRFGRRRVALGAFTAYACVVLAMTQLTPARLLGFGLLFGSAHGLFYPALNALSIERTSVAQRSRVMALVNGSFHLGFMMSVLCFGALAEHSGYPVVFVSAAAVCGVGVALLWLDGRLARTTPRLTGA